MKKDLLFLFDTSGTWIAFRVKKFLFNIDGKWIGWFPWKEDIAITPDGKYLGTIYNNNRLLKSNFQKPLPYPGYPGYPGCIGYPGYPGYIGYLYIPGTTDVDKEMLKGE